MVRIYLILLINVLVLFNAKIFAQENKQVNKSISKNQSSNSNKPIDKKPVKPLTIASYVNTYPKWSVEWIDYITYYAYFNADWNTILEIEKGVKEKNKKIYFNLKARFAFANYFKGNYHISDNYFRELYNESKDPTYIEYLFWGYYFSGKIEKADKMFNYLPKNYYIKKLYPNWNSIFKGAGLFAGTKVPFENRLGLITFEALTTNLKIGNTYNQIKLTYLNQFDNYQKNFNELSLYLASSFYLHKYWTLKPSVLLLGNILDFVPTHNEISQPYNKYWVSTNTSPYQYSTDQYVETTDSATDIFHSNYGLSGLHTAAMVNFSNEISIGKTTLSPYAGFSYFEDRINSFSSYYYDSIPERTTYVKKGNGDITSTTKKTYETIAILPAVNSLTKTVNTQLILQTGVEISYPLIKNKLILFGSLNYSFNNFTSKISGTKDSTGTINSHNFFATLGLSFPITKKFTNTTYFFYNIGSINDNDGFTTTNKTKLFYLFGGSFFNNGASITNYFVNTNFTYYFNKNFRLSLIYALDNQNFTSLKNDDLANKSVFNNLVVLNLNFSIPEYK